MTLAAVTLDDKYALASGRVFLTGVQALVRLPLMQRQRDSAHGLNTAGFISGYRGSPLAQYDAQLQRAQHYLQQNHITFEPGVNEDLAATAVWGSQQVMLTPKAKYDGVFGIWYGKGPGVDRCGDVFRHANMAGTAQHGGVLAICGDDHNAVSSTAAHQSEHNLASWMIPMLSPAGVQEYLDYGLLGWAMSRYAGVWVGFKAVTELVESSASVVVDPHHLQIHYPDNEHMPEGGLNIRWPDDRWSQEERLQKHKLYAALEFARANAIDQVVLDSKTPRFGIVSTGKSYLDVRQALDDLGIDQAMCEQIGLRLYKVGMPWPLERSGARQFAEGLEEVLVVEEKRALIENQLKEQLYNWRPDVRPRVVGKFDEDGHWLLKSHGELSPTEVARAIVKRIQRWVTSRDIEERMAALDAKELALAGGVSTAERLPYFCSGCPHNTSTKVPDGSRALAGIGCHFMALWMERKTETFTQMGGEGVPWIGQQPFTDEKHVFANLGDGTYYHSGLMAIRAAVSANADITYKLLYNDAAAMTGGQAVEGSLLPWQIAQQVYHEGVRKIVIVSDEPDKYPLGIDWPPGAQIHHRDEMDKIQRELRDTPGVSFLLYDQTCAAEKRRRRKRGLFPDPPRRIFINDLVCEGCGDCSVQSNCVSVEPLETEFGRKRQINQSSCNKDYSCIKGFCPSFVTVHGGLPRKAGDAAAAPLLDRFDTLPTPQLPDLQDPYNIIVTGIGGTGVVTIGALLGMAAHVEGKGVAVLDFTGLAQKNGAVMSHIRIANAPEDIYAPRVADGTLDLLLGADLVVAAGGEALRKTAEGTTHAVVNQHVAPTAAFTLDPDTQLYGTELEKSVRKAVGGNRTEFINATRLATRLMGDAIATNLFLLGYAYQRGLLPVSGAAIERAIEINGVAIKTNLKTFNLGRLAAHDLSAVEAAADGTATTERGSAAETLEQIIARRVAFLTDYQNRAYAESYANFVTRIRSLEGQRAPGFEGLAQAVARNMFKLMAYKDEYEVARLHSDPAFRQKLKDTFEGDFTLSYHLAPPFMSVPNPDTGRPDKREFGAYMGTVFGWLARFKSLRGTAFDIFGYTAERKMERQLIQDYRQTIESLLPDLTPDNHALAVEIANLPEDIRGYGPIKHRNATIVAEKQTQLLSYWRQPDARPEAAE